MKKNLRIKANDYRKWQQAIILTGKFYLANFFVHLFFIFSIYFFLRGAFNMKGRKQTFRQDVTCLILLMDPER